MATPAEKGDALQRAVRAVEEHILHTSPALKEKPFLIEDKKIVCVGGVHHEIDIFVTVDAAPGYRAIYIFECKNWKKAIGKKDMIDFSEKIDAVNAAHGYFIAKSFTKDARAQAKKDARITVLVATEHDPTGIPIPGELHLTVTTPKNLQVNAFKCNRSGDELKPIEVQKAELHGAEIDFRDYIIKWADTAMSQDVLRIPSHRMTPGDYDRATTSARHFEPREFLLNGDDIEHMAIEMSYVFSVHKPPLISFFDIESRGRVLLLAPVAARDGVFQMKIIQGPGSAS